MCVGQVSRQEGNVAVASPRSNPADERFKSRCDKFEGNRSAFDYLMTRLLDPVDGTLVQSLGEHFLVVGVGGRR